MLRPWKLTRLFGIDVYVHWTFLLLVGAVLFSNLSAGVDYAAYSVILLGAVFGCVVLHELGHALAARKFGIATRDITLYPIGGVARLERMSERPWEEFWIAVAGPAVNVAIATGLALLLALTGPGLALTTAAPTLLMRGNMFFDLLAVNIMLVIFNMLPAFPMDGGRVFRALLVPRLGRLRATEVAAAVGTAFCIVFAVCGLFGTPMLLFIGLFMYLAGRQELAAVRYSERLRHAEPIDVLPGDHGIADVLPAHEEGAFSGFTWDKGAQMWVLWRNGKPIRMYWAE
jgi:Zn-dependent protease